jgi:type I restriction enzyme, S subunit
MRYKLEDICIMQSGGTPKSGVQEYYDGNIPWATITDISNAIAGELITTKENITSLGLNSINNRLFKKGTLLLAMYGSVGKTAIAGIELSTNQAILGINTKDENLVTNKFLKYWFDYNKRFIYSQGKGATLHNISLTIVKRLQIDLPDIQTQNKIVAILDKASSLIRKREESIVLIDYVLKASFWNTFGDLGVNNYNWPTFQLVNLCKNKDDVRCGPFGTQLNKDEFLEEGIPLWGIKHVNSDFKLQTKEFVSPHKAEALSNYLLIPRDIVMTRKGTIGNCHVYPENFQNGIMHSDILRIRIDEDRVNPYFLSYQFKYNEVLQWQISRVSPGVVMAGINVSRLKKIEVVLPEKKLQDKFHIILKQTELLKKRFEEKKLNELYLSIVQKVFNGQLNFNVDFELDALIDEIDLQNKENDLSKITGDIAYLQRLVDKLNNQEFKEKDLYDKAKHGVFQLMAVEEEKRKVTQEYDENSKSLKLALK